jgi:hypothetical protein
MIKKLRNQPYAPKWEERGRKKCHLLAQLIKFKFDRQLYFKSRIMYVIAMYSILFSPWLGYDSVIYLYFGFLRLLTELNCALSYSADENSGTVSPTTLYFGLIILFYTFA